MCSTEVLHQHAIIVLSRQGPATAGAQVGRRPSALQPPCPRRRVQDGMAAKLQTFGNRLASGADGAGVRTHARASSPSAQAANASAFSSASRASRMGMKRWPYAESSLRARSLVRRVSTTSNGVPTESFVRLVQPLVEFVGKLETGSPRTASSRAPRGGSTGALPFVYASAPASRRRSSSGTACPMRRECRDTRTPACSEAMRDAFV